MWNVKIFGLVLTAFCISQASTSQKPNIIFILADDLGWDDVSFHGSDQIPTPNIDALAYNGIILNNYYVQPICTPSRSALMTGRHPIHTGMQHNVIQVAEPYGLGLDEKLLPQYLKELGYATHMVGKWHLGMCSLAYTPTFRGFDSHFGYWQGKEDYWDHSNGNDKDQPGKWGLDFWNDTEVVRTCFGQYSTELFTRRTEEIIAKHDKSQPLFLYLPHQAVHSGNYLNPLEAPWKYLQNFQHIPNKQRRLFAGMMSALDDSIGNLSNALAQHNMLNNTIIAFSTDNGGPAAGYDMNMACNYPLRGTKDTLWEGGVRGVGFLWSPLLRRSHYVSNHMMQIIDWLPTLLRAAGYDMTKIPDTVDGINLWDTLSNNATNSPRSEILHNIDPASEGRKPRYALRRGDMKIIAGRQDMSGWYKPGQEANSFEDDTLNPEEVVQTISFSTNGQHLSSLQHSDKSDRSEYIHSTSHHVQSVVVICGPKPTNASTNCKPDKAPCLFNIKEDPCEYNNIAHLYPEVVTELLERISSYNATVVPPKNQPADPKGYPEYHKGIWAPWINDTLVEQGIKPII